METSTGFCTKVFRSKINDAEDYTFQRVSFTLRESFGQQPYKMINFPSDQQVLQLLEDIKTRNISSKLGKRVPNMIEVDRNCRISPRGLKYRAIINKKRAKVADLLQACEKVNLSKVSRLSGMSFERVRSIYDEIRIKGEYQRFDFPHQHTKEESDMLEKDIDMIGDGFSTVSDLKNRNPVFSKKYILSLLRKKRFRWRMVPKARREEKQKEPCSQNICHVIRVISSAHYFDDVTVLFVDEMKLPLFQTADWHWRKTGAIDNARYNIRPLKETITAIAMCGIHRFEAVQLYQTEVNTADFTYFLERAIEDLPTNKRYVILLDNATWHHGRFILKSKACKFLLFNEARQFRLNLIENAFSYVRSLYRRRRVTDNINIELESITSIFFGDNCSRKFPGFFRNHLRQFNIMFEKHRTRED